MSYERGLGRCLRPPMKNIDFQNSLMSKLRPNELQMERESLLLESMRRDIRRPGNDGVCNVLGAMETPNERI